jgi:fatty acid desaturase
MSSKRNRQRRSYLGFLGFAGFIGFSYFQDHNVASLSFFAYFGFFAYFWIAKIADQMPDERYLENIAKAKSTAFDIAIIEFVALNLLSAFGFAGKELLVAAVALCFSSLLIIYAVRFYLLEEK